MIPLRGPLGVLRRLGPRWALRGPPRIDVARSDPAYVARLAGPAWLNRSGLGPPDPCRIPPHRASTDQRIPVRRKKEKRGRDYSEARAGRLVGERGAGVRQTGKQEGGRGGEGCRGGELGRGCLRRATRPPFLPVGNHATIPPCRASYRLVELPREGPLVRSRPGPYATERTWDRRESSKVVWRGPAVLAAEIDPIEWSDPIDPIHPALI